MSLATLDKPLSENEALAQGSHGDVAAIFAALLCECGDQVVRDELQLRVRVFCCKVCQLPDLAPAMRLVIRGS